jgi:hypothetical protein
MSSEVNNGFDAKYHDRAQKIDQAAVAALKESAQLRSARRCVLHIPGVGRITAPDSIFFARGNRWPSYAQSDRGIIVK